ncbi:MAG: hypothetical protein AAGB97_00555 [Dehalococcoidia bacterium]
MGNGEPLFLKSRYPLSCSILFLPEGSQEYLGNLRDVTIHPLLKTIKGTEAIVLNRFETLPVGDRKPPFEHLTRGLAMGMFYLSAA